MSTLISVCQGLAECKKATYIHSPHFSSRKVRKERAHTAPTLLNVCENGQKTKSLDLAVLGGGALVWCWILMRKWYVQPESKNAVRLPEYVQCIHLIKSRIVSSFPPEFLQLYYPTSSPPSLSLFPQITLCLHEQRKKERKKERSRPAKPSWKKIVFFFLRGGFISFVFGDDWYVLVSSLSIKKLKKKDLHTRVRMASS